MKTERVTGKLSAGQKLGFGIFDLGGNLLFTLMGFWCLIYLTDTAGLGAALAGTAVMVGKLWDAVTDPSMGFISDRTRSRWGRRRPYLLFGAIPLLLCFWFFFSAPGTSNQGLLMVWATIGLMLVYTASTIVNVPYQSLTPELTKDYNEQSSLNGYRFMCAVIGTILGAAAVQPLVDHFGGGKHGFSMMGLILGAVMAFVTLLTFFGTKERPHTEADYPHKGFFATYKAVFHNKAYVILFCTYALHLTALTFLQTILTYYTTYLYPTHFIMQVQQLPILGAMTAGADVAGIRGTLTTMSMLMMLLFAMIFIPVSVVVSKHIGKKRTYQIAFFIIGTAGLMVSIFGHLIPPVCLLLMFVYAGIGVGFSYVAPYAMVPQAVEYDAIKSGERKEGAYYGMWTFVSKVGQALAIFLTGVILSAGGYVANAVQGPHALTAIRIIIGPIPFVVFFAGLILVNFYPLDEKTYEKMMKDAGR
jgi:GPH family glycoside/pentoside/hexuronide:cation symporter